MNTPWGKYFDTRDRRVAERVLAQARPEIERAAIEGAKPALIEELRPVVRDALVKEVGAEIISRRGASDLVPVPPNTYPQKTPPTYPLYGYDRPLFWSQSISPTRKPDAIIDVASIRKFADTYDVMRSCINHLKREVAAQPFKIVAKDSKDDSVATQARIKEATAFFGKGGGLGEPHETRRHYEAKILEDVSVIGAYAAFKNFNLGGGLINVVAIDAATIRPRYDSYGWPGPGKDYYEQWIMGMLVTGFSPDELTYDGLWPCTYNPWFKSPVEYLIATVLSALKSDEWNRKWLTDGNTPTDMLEAPPDWTPAQIREYADYFDGMLTGNTANRQKSKWVPNGTGRVTGGGRKDQDFASFDLWLLRRCCAIYGVQPASIGFAGEQYKVSQETSVDSTTQFGAGSLLALRKEHYDDLLATLGFDELETQNGANAEEDPLAKAQRLALCADSLTINNRRVLWGFDPIVGGDVVIIPAKAQLYGPDAAGDEAGNRTDKSDSTDGEDTAGDGGDDQAEEDKEVGRWQKKALNAFRRGESPVVAFQTRFFSRERMTNIGGKLTALQMRLLAGETITEEDVKRVFRAPETVKK